MPGGKRTDRLRDQIKEVVSEIIQRRVKDPHVGFVTITDVELTKDYTEATIFYSVYGDSLSRRSTNRALEKAKGFIQSELSRELRIRKSPIIRFEIDRSIEQGIKIEQLLDQIRKEHESKSENQE